MFYYITSILPSERIVSQIIPTPYTRYFVSSANVESCSWYTCFLTQMIPLLVIDSLGHLPGLPGLYLAMIYSASLRYYISVVIAHSCSNLNVGLHRLLIVCQWIRTPFILMAITFLWRWSGSSQWRDMNFMASQITKSSKLFSAGPWHHNITTSSPSILALSPPVWAHSRPLVWPMSLSLYIGLCGGAV